MKKLLFSVITFIYLGMSTGFSMEVHFCMGKKAGIEFFSSENDACATCGMKGKKSECCRDEHHFVKYANDHKNVLPQATPSPDYVLVFPAFFSSHKIIPNPAFFSALVYAQPPPGHSGREICIFHSIFLI